MPVLDELKACISGHGVARPRNHSLSTLVDDMLSMNVTFLISEIAEITGSIQPRGCLICCPVSCT